MRPLSASKSVFSLSLFASLVLASGQARAQNDEYVITLKSPTVIQEALGLNNLPLLNVLTGVLGQLGVPVNTVTAQYSNVLFGFSARLPAALAKRLETHGLVQAVEKVGTFSVQATQSNAQWHLDQIDGAADSQYNYSKTGAGVRAYILDTGINPRHAEFAGRLGNGYDAFAATGGSRPLLSLGPVGVGNAGAANSTNNTTSPDDASTAPVDCHGHGTHVAGLVGGSTYGVAKAVKLHAVRVVGCNGSGSTTQVLSGLDWVVKQNLKPAVINMSLGGAASTAVDNAVKAATDAGFIVVTAAGNNGGNACSYSPGRAPSAINVGAVDISRTIANYSNRGTCIDLFAPGSGITSAALGNNNETVARSGTSMASPIVAGVVAQMLEGNKPVDGEASRLVQEEFNRTTQVDTVKGNLNRSPNRFLRSY